MSKINHERTWNFCFTLITSWAFRRKRNQGLRDVIARWNDKLMAFLRLFQGDGGERWTRIECRSWIRRWTFRIDAFSQTEQKIFFSQYIHTFSTKNRSIRCHRKEELFVTSFTQCLTVKCFFLRRAIFIDVRDRLFQGFSEKTNEFFIKATFLLPRVSSELFYKYLKGNQKRNHNCTADCDEKFHLLWWCKSIAAFSLKQKLFPRTKFQQNFIRN